MYDRTLIIDGLLNIEEALLYITDRTLWINTAADFASSPQGVDILGAVTIRVMAIGEEIKKIDKRSKSQLFVQYPNIDWKRFTELRNFIAHEYFHIDAEEIFDAVKNKLPPLLSTIQQMIADLEK
jgi:uncharacterized protein with HEPN domain